MSLNFISNPTDNETSSDNPGNYNLTESDDNPCVCNIYNTSYVKYKLDLIFPGYSIIPVYSIPLNTLS